MGRRKIEIQPITQERNRSVTFLKRKNGLFKKAYELGVLCSVDVAVIVFESRPGHDAKLHLYSSTNIRNIVQRQIQHQGEEDIKGPADFSGAGGATGADDGEDDDAAGNDEDAEEVPPTRRSKRRRSGGLTMSEVMNPNENDYLPPGNQHSYASGNYLPQFPPPPMHAGRLEPSDLAGMGSLLPVSNDRDSIMSEPHPRHSKRHRRTTLDSMNPGDRSPALQPGGRNSSMIGDRPPATEQYRDPERFYPQMRASPFHDPAPYAYNGQHGMHHPGFNPNPSYAPMYSGYAQNSPPPSFVPVNAAYGAHRGGHSSFSHDMGPAHPQGGNAGAGTSRDAGERFPAAPLPQYDPSLFHPPTGMEPPRHLPADDQGNKRAVDERDGDRSRAGDGGPSSGGPAGIDWPSYRHGYIPPTVSPALRGDGGSRPLGGHGSTGQPAVAHPGDSAHPTGKDSWLDDFAPASASNAPREVTTSRPSTAGGKSAHSEIQISRDGSETGADKSSEGAAGRRKGRKDKGKDAELKDDKVKEEGGGNGEPAKKV